MRNGNPISNNATCKVHMFPNLKLHRDYQGSLVGLKRAIRDVVSSPTGRVYKLLALTTRSLSIQQASCQGMMGWSVQRLLDGMIRWECQPTLSALAIEI